MTQHGFFFDQSRCTGCHTCAIACKQWHDLPPGPLKFLRIYQYEAGPFPSVRLHYYWMPCFHCEVPLCQAACPVDAITKEPRYGAVLIDSSRWIGCGACYEACPYGAPVFHTDDEGTRAQKCDLCIGRLNDGLLPICVLSCPYRALDFAPLDELRERYGDRRDLPGLPEGDQTRPAVVFKPHATKRELVPYDAERAVTLLAKRQDLPGLYNTLSDVLEIPEGLVGRSNLRFKHSSSEDLMERTRNDEG